MMNNQGVKTGKQMMKRICLAVMMLLLVSCTSGTQEPGATTPPESTVPSTVSEPTDSVVEQESTDAPAPTEAVAPTDAPEPVGQRPAFSIGVEAIASGFEQPVHIAHAGDGSGRLFVVEQPGRILVIANGTLLDTPFLDIRNIVNNNAFERGLLSVAFHPDYASNGLFYVNHTQDPNGATSIDEFRVSADANVADPDSRRVLLTIPQPQVNHNGGQSAFGPDGFLYIGAGDGGGAGDQHGPTGNAQAPNVLLGKMLRMDVASGDVAVWAIGLRNPWRFSFDRRTGDLYIADVGQGMYEEINFQAAPGASGVNYGWRIMEGFHCFNPARDCDQSGLTLPIAEYDHNQGCSVTGGHVYRGSEYPWLDGLYFFADYCSGIVWTVERNAAGEWDMIERINLSFAVSSFGEDEQGELYIAGHDDGTIYKLTSTSP
jgi:glucose/arabinose dehydrogenase